MVSGDRQFVYNFFQNGFKTQMLFTGMFGLILGIANPTGVALIIIVTIMVICSLPIVRKSGHFEVFYFSHLLFSAYFVLLILHAPRPWYFMAVPLSLFFAELLYR